ncbi:MAG TPA: prolipoprotein diacylglyceryl transferase [Bacteroidales bacterium]|nr:prolipoprotein diacylglyceryl transferase [Bacteroidales bacterium]
MLTAYITWNVDPEIFRIGNLAVRYYGLLFALGFYLGYLIMARIFRIEKVPQARLDQLALLMIAATIIGARLGHCLFYEPEYYLSRPLEMFMVWKGGLASHGAAIGILLALWWFTKKSGKSFLWILDRIVITVALAGSFIRLGNLMNSEIYGEPTSLPWGFLFLRNFEELPRHPTQIYESLAYLLIFVFLYLTYEKKRTSLKEGFNFGWFLVLLFTTRFLVEFIKNPQVGFEEGMALNMGQLLSIPFILMGAWILFRYAYAPRDSKG